MGEMLLEGARRRTALFAGWQPSTEVLPTSTTIRILRRYFRTLMQRASVITTKIISTLSTTAWSLSGVAENTLAILNTFKAFEDATNYVEQ